MLEWEGADGSGELSVRVATHHVYRFRFDSATAFHGEAPAEGDLVDILADRPPGEPRNRALEVQLLRQAPRNPEISRPRRSPVRATVVDETWLRARTALAGVVLRLSDERFVVRTRLHGEKTIVRRPDTRYSQDGERVDPSALKVNTYVYVRGRTNLDQEFEAYQVVWGEILSTK